MTATPTTTTLTDAEATLALAERFLKAVNTKDADALLETLAEDCVYDLRAAPFVPIAGHDNLRQALAALVTAFPDYDFVIDAIRADATQFVAEWTMTGTLATPYPVGTRVAIPDGRPITFRGVDICPVTNGKITAKISYVDATAWYENFTFAD